ncbi:MAG: F0F1 ATP synthase subunit A [Candidatus Izemoplasmatales bacterium]|uniref:F0F1 ATP synthase subunit A n=1 Tax=Hujiaoplasma nucleasis TaxID=2725268 RepID=A0A7L6N3Z5_9MOLU|nr:F0F1 ATP synthase subunit A [Hujiaoplasma nucleasis]QLY40261.1 F0F1 ATP synthase subunit A [Hujiaoplasma nucleasis]
MNDFTLFEPLSSAARSTIIVFVLLSVLLIVIGMKIKKLDPKKTPKGFLFGCIMLVDTFNNFVSEYMEKDKFKFFGPYLFTITIFLATANTISLVGLTPPLSNLAVALAFTVITFIVIKIAEFKYISLKTKAKNLMGPVVFMSPIMLPINLIGEVSTPFTMGLRLFVNLLSGVVIATMVYSILTFSLGILQGLFGIFAGVFLHVVFDIFFGLIQAFVFLMLSTINISLATDS